MLLILLLAFAAGASGLNLDVFWVDEIYSISNMGAFDPPYSPGRIIESLYEHSPNQTPAFYFLGAAWAHFAGWSQVALRLLPTLCGILMIACLYRFGKDALGARVGLVAAALMASSAYVIWYMHEFRMYSLGLLLGVLHFWQYWRLARGHRASWLAWMRFVASGALLLYTQILAAPLLAGIAVVHFIFAPRNRRWLQLNVAWAVCGILFVPFILRASDGISEISNAAGAFISPKALSAFARLASNGAEAFWPLLLALLGLALWRERNRAALRLLLIALFMLLALAFINWHYKQIYASRIRYMLPLWIPLCLLFAYGLTAYSRWRLISAGFLLLWIFSGSQLSYQEIIGNYAGSADRILLYPPLHRYVDALRGNVWQPDYLIGFQRRRQLIKAEKHGWSTADYYTDVLLGIDGMFLDADKQNNLEDDLKQIRRRVPWFLLAHDPANPPSTLEPALDEFASDYVACASVVDRPDLRIQRYVSRVLPCKHLPRTVEFDAGIRLVDRHARFDSEDDRLRVMTWWQVADEAALKLHNISLQIVDESGEKAGQMDLHLSWKLLPWTITDLPTADLPPGEYQLVLIVYNRISGAKLAGMDLSYGESRKFLPVADFRVEE